MRSKITKNYIFRWFDCGLSIEETAKLCFKAESTVKGWDAGKLIPRECRLLMELATGKRVTPLSKGWEGWRFSGDELISPDNIKYTPKRLSQLQFIAANNTESMTTDNVRKIRERLNRL